MDLRASKPETVMGSERGGHWLDERGLQTTSPHRGGGGGGPELLTSPVSGPREGQVRWFPFEHPGVWRRGGEEDGFLYLQAHGRTRLRSVSLDYFPLTSLL